ncbi:MAG TPA: endonuclease/exonuclease/phosphatase family protein [Bacteroidota bacterium]|nr:endonuclease/exonuclease/phosphatase family protein [Bacteroidota bacterium]
MVKQFVIFCFLVIALGLIAASCASPKETTAPKPEASIKTPVPSAEVRPQRDSIRILSINALHALRDEASVKRFASWIRSVQPDVVAVQQIERPMEGKKDFDAVKELAVALDMRPFFGMARYYKGFDSGNALFSTYPIHQSTVESLPVSKGKVRRSIAYSVIDVGLQSVGFASTEIDDQSASERKSQTRGLVELLPQFKDFPFVVCGEFYERPSSPTVGALKGRCVCANELDGAPQDLTQHLYTAARTVTPVAARKVVNKDIHSDALVVTLRVVSQ